MIQSHVYADEWYEIFVPEGMDDSYMHTVTGRIYIRRALAAITQGKEESGIGQEAYV